MCFPKFRDLIRSHGGRWGSGLKAQLDSYPKSASHGPSRPLQSATEEGGLKGGMRLSRTSTPGKEAGRHWKSPLLAHSHFVRWAPTHLGGTHLLSTSRQRVRRLNAQNFSKSRVIFGTAGVKRHPPHVTSPFPAASSFFFFFK